jgi:hypothetical protein
MKKYMIALLLVSSVGMAQEIPGECTMFSENSRWVYNPETSELKLCYEVITENTTEHIMDAYCTAFPQRVYLSNEEADDEGFYNYEDPWGIIDQEF